VNPLKSQELKESLEVAFFDHLRETTINQPEKNLDHIEAKEPDDVCDDAFQRTFQDICEETCEDTCEDLYEDTFGDPFDDP
jgi:hypothetical protein